MHTPTTTRRHALHLLAAAAGLAALPALAASPAKIPMEVWKDPNCGCCKDWIVLMEQAGFAVTVHDSGNSAVRAKLGLPVQYGSCHTALVGGYLVEGHVPAADVHKLLKDKPKALGITVPGMPIGSPGMDGPEYGGRKDPYDVLLVTKSLMGSTVSTRVFTSYR
ncbi:DUF411 domain-containing protein [Comamonas aquatica]|jgi:hypothetical protein|uniref:DUF411 domain-containing protein n=1 Tax=Comamonas aquatica TaxID=225991 RepID=A0AA42W238_9BURK|nr:DUF411 domain-containing protein [Comamonas aquatica]MDH0371471.1 DUF411 domain-containing protein [Comamonas aquatica]MDH0493194.1 DUF411 domain-containing protein [Comamonas aquatica]MDH1428009.1 DUF411 domain-containing protein [Comamonas aquatica]MDH1605946.1 DUF411 domain-containing protein [Comamonas aquatica]MDH1616316.1 DUF411 domain-containing protein [Comamonas aquatica]